MEQLMMLQEYESSYVMAENDHEAHASSDDQKKLKDAIHELRSLLRLLKQQESPGLPPYVTYRRFGSGKLCHECKIHDLALPADTAIHKDLFSKVYGL
jgi:hypothetical protein